MLQFYIQTHTELLHVEATPVNPELVPNFAGLLGREMRFGCHFLSDSTMCRNCPGISHGDATASTGVYTTCWRIRKTRSRSQIPPAPRAATESARFRRVT